MRNFVGSLQIPTYKSVQEYNFHDTLEILIKRMFQDDVKERYKRYESIEDK